MASWYRQHVRLSESSPLWGAFRASRGVPPQDAGISVADWAFEFIDVGSHQDNLMDLLANGSVTVPLAPSPPTPMTTTHYGTLPPLHVTAPTLQAKSWGAWPWVVAAGAAALLYGGLVYRRKGRRRR